MRAMLRHTMLTDRVGEKMPASRESTARALDAVAEVADLFKLAHCAVDRARGELKGDALDVANRLSLQLQYLRNVVEVLRHEAGRPAGASANRAPNGLGTSRPTVAVVENKIRT